MGSEQVAVVAVTVRTTDGRTVDDLRHCLLDGVPWQPGPGNGTDLVPDVAREAARAAGSSWAGDIVEDLHEAVRAVAERRLDTAVVASAGTGCAVAIVLKRHTAALREGNRSLALVEDGSADPAVEGPRLDGSSQSGGDLLRVACAVLAIAHRAMPRPNAPARLLIGTRDTEVATSAGPVRVRVGDAVPWVVGAPVSWRVYSGADRGEVLEALRTGRPGDGGPARLVVWSAGGEPPLGAESAAEQWLRSGGPRPDGVAYRDRPLPGQVAFLFGNGAASYPGMGTQLLLAFPDLVAGLEQRYGPIDDLLGATDGSALPRALRQIWGSGVLAGVHHGVMADLLGIRPDAVVGYSSGEMTALVATGAWRDPDEVVRRVRDSWLYTDGVVGRFDVWRQARRRDGAAGGEWSCHLVGAPADRVRRAIEGEATAYLMLVNSPESCVVGGDPAACARVVSRLGGPSWEVDYPIVAHVPELAEVRDQLWRLYHHPTVDVGTTRYYSCATTGWYSPTPDAVADALAAQLVGTADFAGTVRRAWEDGVRVFVELGPKGLCANWTRQVLGAREHLAVALDVPGAGGVRQLLRAVAEVTAAGVRMDVPALLGRLVRPPLHPVRPVPLVAHHRRVARLHREFVEREAVVHDRFLGLRAEMAALLRAAGATVGTASPAAVLAATASPVTVPPATPPVTRPAPLFGRAELERHAEGRVAEVFGPRFAGSHGSRRRTRLPKPPVLLVDRVVALDAEPASMTGGVIRTQTDVRAGDWYLDPTGRVAPALLAEFGQGNILLLSWLGVDSHTSKEQVYRMLDCEVTHHGSPPGAGDTVDFETTVEGVAEHGGVLLASFRADCHVNGEPRLTVRHARAGFFDQHELDGGTGIRWRPEGEPLPQGPLDLPPRRATRSAFGPPQLRALLEGRPADCFGDEWGPTRSHVRTPRIAGGRLRALDEVTALDWTGGPWGRGHLRAESAIAPDEWYFAAHFENDPCMPGSLMLQGCHQAMAFYLSATGCTVERDGWRFEPVPDRPVRLTCRAQATPRTRRIVYEVFVRELSTGTRPTLVADVLCSVDGVGALHARELAVRLVPDWPLDQWRSGPVVPRGTAPALPSAELGGLGGHREPRMVAEADGFRFDYASLLACAWGRPSEGFGPAAASLDDAKHIAPRCPGPPYHFMSRIAEVTGPMGGMRAGTVAEVEYDVPERAWFFEHEDRPVMPFAVLLEAALQPCGWLAAYSHGFDQNRKFRNLDGVVTVLAEVGPGAGVLCTRALLRESATSGGTTILRFVVECRLGDTPVLTLSTTFGFFPPEAFVGQGGLLADPAHRAALTEPSEWREQSGGDRRPGTGLPSGDMLRVLDRITGYWPDGGRAGLGRVRGEKEVDGSEWFFRAHFFQDPVQPGSLGLEAMCLLLRWYAWQEGLGRGVAGARFEPVALGRPVTWKYRGQVLPANRMVIVTADVLEVVEEEHGYLVVALAELWVDGKWIHQADFGLRVVAD
ncbi:hypothetical protein P3102_15215 [Amycolatopsis sp. QT-25]|uniref:acyltransferase domain-containing protein n=1 Tax=Amycolatopsis sp. QT-25 TaxID=3034022 RepID=UPI0023EB18F7|nr:acyltransferase domain-containing protein [Amycolatopsis sp. QT-25]WET82456.1 hypothetical protein P3102_15215 [Amycolatopsis sp. QT-25]